MYLNLKARKCCVIFSFLWSIQSALCLLLAQEKMGFAHSFVAADNVLGDCWGNLDSQSNEEYEFSTATEIPLTHAIQPHNRPKLDFDPILHLFQMEQESTGRIAASNLVCSLEEPASFSTFPEHVSPFSNITIQAAISWDQFSQADSFMIDGPEDVTLILGGTFTQKQIPHWLAAWNKLAFIFHQPGRGACQFYFQHFEDGIIVLGNNSMQARQKIFLVLMEKSCTQPLPEQPGVEANRLEPLKSAICVKFLMENPGSCSIQIIDFNENCIRTLEHQENLPAGLQVAAFWDGCNAAGMTVANGIYYYRILAKTKTQVFDKKLKMVVLR